jgi:hypothetical protein
MPNEVNKYICIAGDIVNSSKFNSETMLAEIINDLNTKYKKTIVTPFAVRLGDEIIGTLDSFSDGYRVLLDLYGHMKKHNKGMYVGIGFGRIDNPSTQDIHKVNGSAIRSAISARDEYLKKRHPESDLFLQNKSHFSFFAKVEDFPFPCKAINHFMYQIYEQLENQTEKQSEVIQIMERSEKITYKEIASKLGVRNDNEANISKLLKRSNYKLVQEAKQGLFELLDYLQEGILDKGEST